MTAIPSFHIEGLSTDGENTPGTIITGLTSTDYDSLIKTHPEARLKYLDEDEDEVIVGSSAELIDRINDLPSNLPLKFQTATSLGLDGWLAFLLDRSTPAADRPSSPEDLERTLFEGFQRDLEAAIKASLVPDAVPSSSTTPPQRPKPQTVDSFLNAIASTVQSTLSSVYPHTAQITTSLRQNPALRQAAEVLQTVGRTAQQTVQHPEERAKVATEIATEIKSAVQVVGGVLGDMMQEVGSGLMLLWAGRLERV
ncbi:hypothetical protein BJ508DRAFT_122731 [Ascobolus immersus RN42]|uniref:Uncharacterized protein n=1 Tax=Ascobolus immersus RN42 TaxID=1160509 RepID=A0A3N4I3X2_ASCIM|nr:hypothetical protein BJ508DRAFT_122731 [Ascobolus immersus RN42]